MTAALIRAMPGPVELVDRDTIRGRMVPWGVDAEVVDELPGGRYDRYIESFASGAFDAQRTSGNRGTINKIEFVETHTGGLGKIGYALELDNRDDGAWAVFRVLPRHRDDIAQMVDDGIDGLSVRFIPKRDGTRVEGRVGRLERRVRTDVHLEHVALVAEPTWSDARVLAMRALAAEDEAAAAAERQARADVLLAEMDSHRDRWAHLLTSSD